MARENGFLVAGWPGDGLGWIYGLRCPSLPGWQGGPEKLGAHGKRFPPAVGSDRPNALWDPVVDDRLRHRPVFCLAVAEEYRSAGRFPAGGRGFDGNLDSFLGGWGFACLANLRRADHFARGDSPEHVGLDGRPTFFISTGSVPGRSRSPVPDLSGGRS